MLSPRSCSPRRRRMITCTRGAAAAALAAALLSPPLSAQQNTEWHGVYMSVQQEATASETPFDPGSANLPLASSGSFRSRLQKQVAIVLKGGEALGTMISVSQDLGISISRARAGCRTPGPIQTFWSRGVEEKWTESRATGRATVDINVESDGLVSLNFELSPGKGETGYRTKSTGGITCWGDVTDPGQEKVQPFDNEDPEGASVSGTPNQDGVLQGMERVATTHGTIVARWYFRRGRASCEPDSVMLEMARERADAEARGAQESFLQVAAFVTQISSDPVVAEVGAFLRSHQGKIVSAYAALRAAGGAGRDGARAAYGQAVANVMAQHSGNTARLAAAGVPAVDAGPPDPRYTHLSSLMLQFGVQAQVMQHWLEEVDRSRQRYAACLGR